MNLFKLFLPILFFCSQAFSQQSNRITLITDNKVYPISSEIQNGTQFISLNELVASLELKLNFDKPFDRLQVDLDSLTLDFNKNNPYVVVKNKNFTSVITIQLVKLPYQKENNFYVSLNEVLDLINNYSDKQIQFLSPTRLRLFKKSDIPYTPRVQKSNPFVSISVEDYDDNSLIKLTTKYKIESFYNFYRENNLHLYLWNVKVTEDTVILRTDSDILKSISVTNHNDFSEIQFELKEFETITEILKGDSENEIIVRIGERDFGDWYTLESDHFKLVYRDSHSHLANYLLISAERSLEQLMKLFNYKPKEKIIINTYDVSDYGFAATTTVPQDYIRIEIEPLEPGYEVVPYNERYQWLLSHELTHIVVNDMASSFESGLRSIIGKVNPDKTQPATVFYSLFTNHNRYTPRWHQESMAVFVETWFSGGFGRILGSFDEMYFRTLVQENRSFASEDELEEIESHEKIFLENLFYTYGARLVLHLAINYGADKLLSWFKTESSEFYPSYKVKFKDIFGVDFSVAWASFIESETAFQKRNLQTLSKAPLTELKYLGKKNLGWVGQPHYDETLNSVLFAYHHPGKLATMSIFNLSTYETEDFHTLPTPSMLQVASTAYDEEYGNYFYTTNNNLLYRDLHLIGLKSNQERDLFIDSRTGHLTISKKTHELYGIQHTGGKAILVRSEYPYQVLQSLTVFPLGVEVQHIAINEKASLLAAVLHYISGEQSIVLIDLVKIKEGKGLEYLTISSSGSPENVSWSRDGNYLYWNAYTNGVSNIYKYNLNDGELIALTNTLKGLFRPLEISKDSIFAYEFTADGFTPVMFYNGRASKLPAINYLGQAILNNSPQVTNWLVKTDDSELTDKYISKEQTYRGLNNFRFQTIIPVISGFQDRKVLGIFAHLTDPLLIHELLIETGVSPFHEKNQKTRFHLRAKYNLKQKFTLAYEYNAPDFYDLFNERKRAMLGNRFAVSYNDFWLYDNPLKIKQNTDLSLYTGVRFINDNLVEVSEPDFAVFKTEFDARNLRRTIGSIDFESGNWFRINLVGFASDPKDIQFSGGIYAEWDNYNLLFFTHNVLHLKLAAGYHYLNDRVNQGRFYFGGFGNREIENEPVKQFEKVFRFPGVPIYSIASENFLKVMIENNLPPLRIPNISIFSHSLRNINLSFYSQGLLTNSVISDKWVNIGGQINFMFTHWSNLESTFSAGIAKAWWEGGNEYEWFLSFKLLKD